MTTPLDSSAFPTTPDAPSTTPAGYVSPTLLDPGKREPPISAERIESMRGNLIDLILREVVSSILGFFSPALGSAYEQLYEWFNDTLETLIINPLSALVTLLVDILDSIPFIGEPLGNAVEDLAALFGLLKSRDDNSQNSADTANNGVASLNAQLASIIAPPGGVYINDNFDRSGSDLGPNWVQVYTSGVGSMRTDGNNCYWQWGGAAERTCKARHVTPLATDTQMCSIVHAQPTNTTHATPELHMILRCNEDLDEFVMAKVYHSGCEIGYVVGGAYTRLGDAESFTVKNGDRWEFKAGTSTDERQFLLYRNDALVCDRTDSADASSMGVDHLYAGLGMRAGVTFVPFTFLQVGPPSVQGWAAADRAA